MASADIFESLLTHTAMEEISNEGEVTVTLSPSGGRVRE